MDTSKDEGVIAVLIERFNKERLPRMLRLKEKVDSGEKLGDMDISFIQEVFKDANHVLPLGDRHPEYQDLIAKVIRLYHEITEQALKNEQG
jgi:ATP-dependent helicase/DNAse subunit B